MQHDAGRVRLQKDSARAMAAVGNQHFASVEPLWKANEPTLLAGYVDIRNEPEMQKSAQNLCIASSYALYASKREEAAVSRLRSCARLVPSLGLGACHWNAPCDGWLRAVWAEHVFQEQGEVQMISTAQPSVDEECHFEVDGLRPWQGRYRMQTMQVAPGRYQADVVCKNTRTGGYRRVRKLVDVAAKQRVQAWWDLALTDLFRPAGPVSVEARYDSPFAAYSHDMALRQLAERMGATEVLVASPIEADGLRLDWYGISQAAQSQPSAVKLAATSQTGQQPLPQSWHRAVAVFRAQNDIPNALRDGWGLLMARKCVDHRGAGMTPIDPCRIR